ncbi:MAG: hypothetical protein QM729_06385 [Solirubrobacterales bacterium]
MRKLILIPLILTALLALAACGGGGSSSSSGGTEGTTTADTPESAWADEVTEVFSEFENKVSAQLTEEISSASSPALLKPLYATYSVDLSVLGNKLENTEATKACVALREKMVGYVREVAELTEKLGSSGKYAKLDETAYAVKVAEQGQHIDKVGRKLGTLTTDPSC